MIVNIGSKNAVKIEAVKEAMKGYGIFSRVMVNFFSADSGVSEQPKSMDETIRGAMNRARECFSECCFSIGLTENEKIGSYCGAIGLLTKGRVTRKCHIKQAFAMAMIHLENSGEYCRK